MTQKPPTSAAAEEIVRYMQKVWAKDDGSPLDKSCTFTKEEFCHVVVSIRKLEAQQTDALRQRIDNAHADIYSVWNGGKLSAVDLNHLESALAILGHIIDELKSPRGGDTLSELRTQIEALIDKALDDLSIMEAG